MWKRAKYNGDREIRCGRVWKVGQKANGPNRLFRKGLWMWSNVIPREDQGEMGIRSVRPANNE